MNKINMIFFLAKSCNKNVKFLCWVRNYWRNFNSYSLFYIWSKAAECGKKTGLLCWWSCYRSLLLSAGCLMILGNTAKIWPSKEKKKKKTTTPNPSYCWLFSPKGSFFMTSSSNSVSCSNLRKIWRKMTIFCKAKFWNSLEEEHHGLQSLGNYYLF